MIILDEQLLGRNIEVEIARWYPGAVQFIIDLRADTVIKDDAIPGLLRQQKQPTFVTINERDFWRKVDLSSHFCAVCFTLPDSRVNEIPQLLRALFHYPAFKTKAKRMGKVIRITTEQISYYTFRRRQAKVIPIK